MTMTVQRPPDAPPLIAWRFDASSFPINSQLVVGTDECVVAQTYGQVLGVIGPGTHWIHPQPFPFFGQHVEGSNISTELWFVRTTNMMGFQFGGSVGTVPEPVAELAVQVRAFGDFSAVVTDPTALVRGVLGNPMDGDALMRWVAMTVMNQVKELVMTLAVQESVSFVAPKMSQTVTERFTTPAEISQIGIKVSIHSLNLSMAEDDKNAIMKALAEKAARARAAKMAPPPAAAGINCRRCNTHHDGGRFCVQCGAPLA